MSELNREIMWHITDLDDVEFQAIIALMKAMVGGCNNHDAIAAGNAVFIAAGREPVLTDVPA